LLTFFFAFAFALAGKLEKRVYNDPKWKKTLLETPSGFALFEVSEAILKEPEVRAHFSFFLTHALFLFLLDFAISDKSLHILSIRFTGHLGVL
jgi:hypothetical protein